MQKRVEITDKNPSLPGWSRVLLFILPYIFCTAFFQIIGNFFLGNSLEDFGSEKTPFQTLIIHIFDLLGLFFIVLLFRKGIDKDTFINLGFHLDQRIKDIVYGILVGFIIMAVGFSVLYFSNEIQLSTIDFNFQDFLISIGLFIIVAVVEEVLCRGYILGNLMFSMNKYLALIVSSSLFTLLHIMNPNTDWFSFLSLFIAGILLGITYIHTRNLWFPIALHFSWNFFQSLFGFNVSGQDFFSIFNFSITNPNKINGGAFGFEGSYLSTLLELIVIGYLVYFYSKQLQNEVIKH